MPAKIRIEHVPKGWIEIFKSSGMKSVVDQAGERIASTAGSEFAYTEASNNRFTVAGFVSTATYEGRILEATEKTLTKAVSR